MRRLEVRRFLPEPLDGQNPFVLILQARDHDAMPSVVVAPLERASRRRLTNFELPIEYEGVSYLALIQELSAEPKSEIGEVVARTDHFEWDVVKALDRLLFGV